MTTYDEISIIANILANQGKKPTVALVKTKLSAPVPLPTLIKVLKAWQHDPDFIAPKSENSSMDIATNETVMTSELTLAIADAIKPLRAEVAELKALLKEALDKR